MTMPTIRTKSPISKDTSKNNTTPTTTKAIPPFRNPDAKVKSQVEILRGFLNNLSTGLLLSQSRVSKSGFAFPERNATEARF